MTSFPLDGVGPLRHPLTQNTTYMVTNYKMGGSLDMISVEEPDTYGHARVEHLLRTSRVDNPKEKAAKLEEEFDIETMSELMDFFIATIDRHRQRGRIIPKIDDMLEMNLDFEFEDVILIAAKLQPNHHWCCTCDCGEDSKIKNQDSYGRNQDSYGWNKNHSGLAIRYKCNS